MTARKIYKICPEDIQNVRPNRMQLNTISKGDEKNICGESRATIGSILFKRSSNLKKDSNEVDEPAVRQEPRDCHSSTDLDTSTVIPKSQMEVNRFRERCKTSNHSVSDMFRLGVISKPAICCSLQDQVPLIARRRNSYFQRIAHHPYYTLQSAENCISTCLMSQCFRRFLGTWHSD